MGNIISCIHGSNDKRRMSRGKDLQHKKRNVSYFSEEDNVKSHRKERKPYSSDREKKAVAEDEWKLCDIDEADLLPFKDENNHSLKDSSVTTTAATANAETEDNGDDEQSVPVSVLARIQKAPSPQSHESSVLPEKAEAIRNCERPRDLNDTTNAKGYTDKHADEPTILMVAEDIPVFAEANDSLVSNHAVIHSLNCTALTCTDDFDIYHDYEHEPELEAATKVYHHDGEDWGFFCDALAQEYKELHGLELSIPSSASDRSESRGLRIKKPKDTGDDEFIKYLLNVILDNVRDVITLREMIKQAEELKSLPSLESRDDLDDGVSYSCRRINNDTSDSQNGTPDVGAASYYSAGKTERSIPRTETSDDRPTYENEFIQSLLNSLLDNVRDAAMLREMTKQADDLDSVSSGESGDDRDDGEIYSCQKTIDDTSDNQIRTPDVGAPANNSPCEYENRGSRTPEDRPSSENEFIQSLLNSLLDNVRDAVTLRDIIKQADDLDSVSSEECGDERLATLQGDYDINDNQNRNFKQASDIILPSNNRNTPDPISEDFCREWNKILAHRTRGVREKAKLSKHACKPINSLSTGVISPGCRISPGKRVSMAIKSETTKRSASFSCGVISSEDPIHGAVRSKLTQSSTYSPTNSEETVSPVCQSPVRIKSETNQNYVAIKSETIQNSAAIKSETIQNSAAIKSETPQNSVAIMSETIQIAVAKKPETIMKYVAIKSETTKNLTTTSQNTSSSGRRVLPPRSRIPIRVRRVFRAFKKASRIPVRIRSVFRAIKKASKIPVRVWKSSAKMPEVMRDSEGRRTIDADDIRIPGTAIRKPRPELDEKACSITGSDDVDQFQATNLYKQRFKMSKQGNEIWKKGLTKFQIWVIMHSAEADTEGSLPTKPRLVAVKARISSWRPRHERRH